jgi:Methylamine utilisation protein MauE
MMELLAFAADPIAVGAIVGALALVMFAAAWHKFSEPDSFGAALAGYRILPQWAVAPAARVLPVVEAGFGVAVLIPITRPFALPALAVLVVVYALAIAVNLARGRRNIDCGCGGATHPVSWGLVVRNLVLAAAAMLASRPMLDRAVDWFDLTTLVLGVLAFYGLYLMADELLRQASRFAQLNRHGGEQG